MMSITDEIEITRRHLKYLEEMEKKEREMNPKYRLAEYLHTTICHHNHTDGCGWYYEIKNGVHDWERYEHKAYLKDAEKLLSITTEEIIKEVVSLRIVPLKDAIITYVNIKKEATHQ